MPARATARYVSFRQLPLPLLFEKGEGLYGKTVEYIHAFNTFPVDASGYTDYIDNCYDGLFNNAEGAVIPPEMKRAARDILLEHYVRASLIAKHYQKIYATVGRWYMSAQPAPSLP